MNKVVKNFLGVLFCFFTTVSVGQYSGTYTVGGSSPDFSSLTAAFRAFNSYGINGKVRLNVRSGVYNEQIEVYYRNGASSTNMISVGPDPNNSSPVIYKYKNRTKASNYIVNVGLGYVRFDSIQFIIDSASWFGRIVEFTDACEYVTFNACHFSGKDTAMKTDDYALMFDNDIDRINNYTVTNCRFLNGSTAIIHQGFHSLTATPMEKGFVFKNNTLLNFYAGGVTVLYNYGPIIEGNYLKDINKLDAATGISISFIDSTFNISNNQIYINGESGSGLSTNYCRCSSKLRNNISNNFVSLYDSSKSGASSAISLSGTQHTDLNFNSLYSANKSTSSKALYFSNSTLGYKVKNNTVIHAGKGYAVYLWQLDFLELDFNNYYSLGSNIGFFYNTANGGVPIKTFSELQKTSDMDRNSINIYSAFKSSRDLHTKSYHLKGAGVPISGYVNDIDGQTRNTSHPDIGADEFEPLSNDLYLVNFNFSKLTDCGNDSTEVGVVIKNTGKNNQGKFIITLEVKGSTNQKVSINYSDTLKALSRDTLFFTKFNTLKGGSFELKAYTSLSNDDDRSNDSQAISINLDVPPNKPQPNFDTLCANEPFMFTTNHASGTILRWYKNRTDLRPIIESNNLIGAGLQKDTTLYVSSVLYSGKRYSSITTLSATGNNCAGGIMFDLIPKRKLTIDSISTIFNAAGLQTVYIYTKKGTFSGSETNSSKWKFHDSVKVGPVSAYNFFKFPLKKTITLEKDSVTGIYLQYSAKFSAKTGLTTFTNQDIRIAAGSGLCSKFGGLNKNMVFNGQLFYNYLPECESDRVPYNVKVNITKVNLGKDTSFCEKSGIILKLDPGNKFVTYDWSTAETSSNITVTKEGTYSLKVIDINGCAAEDKITITKNANPKVFLGNDTSYCLPKGSFYTINADKGYYSYTWQPTGSGQIAKDTVSRRYSIRVTNQYNCEALDTISIIAHRNPHVNLGKDTTYCTSKSISRLLDAGGGYLKYNWNTNSTAQKINSTGSGKFSVIVSDSFKCFGGDTISIAEHLNPRLDLGKDSSFCFGGSLKLDAGLGYLYVWSTGAKTQSILADSSGSYIAEIRDFYNCTDRDTVNVEVYPNPIVELGSDKIVDPNKPISVILDAGKGFKTYMWNTFDTTQTILVESDGNYFVKVTDLNECSANDTIVVRYWAKGNLGKSLWSNVYVFPNPANQILSVYSDNGVIENIKVFDSRGKLVVSNQVKSTEIKLSTSEWGDGIYLISLNHNGKLLYYKVVIQH